MAVVVRPLVLVVLAHEKNIESFFGKNVKKIVVCEKNSYICGLILNEYFNEYDRNNIKKRAEQAQKHNGIAAHAACSC